MLLTFPNKIQFIRTNLVEETKPCEISGDLENNDINYKNE
jgi:hypothetical protein